MSESWSVAPKSWDELTNKPAILADNIIDWNEINNRPDVQVLADNINYILNNYSLATHSHSSLYSPLSHNHDSTYSPLSHTHSQYSSTTHNHALSALTDTTFTSLASNQLMRFNGTKWINFSPNYAEENHNHNSTYSTISHNHDTTYAPLSHTHSQYSSTTHNHALSALTDTTFTSLVSNQLMKFDGTKWINFSFSQPTPLDSVAAPVTDFYSFIGDKTQGYPDNYLTVQGLHLSSSRSTQLAINRSGDRAFFRGSISSTWQPWSEIYNSRNLILGTTDHIVQGNFFSGLVGDYRYSDTPFQRYCMTFNAYTSPTSSTGYRYRNSGFAFWIDQRSDSGDIWFNSSSLSGSAGDQVPVQSLFSFQKSTNRILFYQKLSLLSLPASSTGLITGDLWRDSNGFLRIV